MEDHNESVKLTEVLREVANDVFHGHKHHRSESYQGFFLSFFRRAQESLKDKLPRLKDGLRSCSSDVLQWMHRGGPWRAFLVSVIGIILLLGLSGFACFMLVFLIATANAIAIGFLGSVASVGAFTAFFFMSLIAIYIGALIIAVFVISTVTFLCICAALTAAGWIAFFWLLWQGVKKGLDICKVPYCLPFPKVYVKEVSPNGYYEKTY